MNDPFLVPSHELSNLPAPGEIVIYDYSEKREKNELCESGEFRVRAVQWNIERAYKLDEIIELLGHESTGFKDCNGVNYRASKILRKTRGEDARDIAYRDFDVLAIQEFDIGCARSNYRNSPLELARALKMKCVFLCEFEELYSEKLRNKRCQGGGVHGNGLLTWWDVERVEVIDHVEIFDWNGQGEKLNEPRRGSRRSLACFLKHPLDPSKRLLVYSVHLEVFCGIFGRLRQFSQILEHSRSNLATHPHQMILGDLNTMAHGLARFFPKYCCDAMRWRSVGWSEAEWWQRNLFAVTPELAGNDGINQFLAAHHHPKKPNERIKNVQIEQEIEHELEENCANCENFEDCVDCEDCELEKCEQFESKESHQDSHTTDRRDNQEPRTGTSRSESIFTQKELKNLINPYFFCPFPVSRSKTLEMHGYSGKLDWMLLRGWRVLAKGFDNEGYRRSDHKLLWTEVVAFANDEEDNAKAAHNHHVKSLNQSTPTILLVNNLSPATKWLIGAGMVGFTGVLLYHLIKPK